MDYRSKGNKDNNADDGEDVTVYVRHFVAEDKSADRETDRPNKSADNVVSKKSAVSHRAHAGHDGCEGADDGYEARNHDGFDAVLLVKILRFLYVGMFKEARIFAVEEFFSNFFSKEIAHTVAQDGGDKTEWCENPDIHSACAGEYSCGKEEAVSGKEEPKEKSGLRKDDGKDAEIPGGGDDGHEVKHARYYTRFRLFSKKRMGYSRNMELLILTQKIDSQDSILGFFHAWVAEFSKHCERVTVVCLQKGEYALPENVRVFSLGKEEKKSRFVRVFRFYKYIWRERKNYDAVFVHMNPEYVVLGGLPWRIFGKKISLWYTHKSVDTKLRIAEKFSHVVFTASKESFRLPSRKLRVMGHGIDTGKFLRSAGSDDARHENSPTLPLQIVTVGRISPVKDYETLLAAAKILAEKDVSFRVQVFGIPETPEQEKYLRSLKEIVERDGLIEKIYFCGAVTQDALPGILREADIFVNMSHTGGLDKAVLEAMACEIPVLTCNETFVPILGKSQLMYTKGNAIELADKIIALAGMGGEERASLGRDLRNVVVEHHSLSKLIPAILKHLWNNK